MFARCGECAGGVGPGVPGVGGRELFSLLYEVLRGGGFRMPAFPLGKFRGGSGGS